MIRRKDLYTALSDSAFRFPDKIALVEAGTGKKVSYHELLMKVDRAADMYFEHGIRKGEMLLFARARPLNLREMTVKIGRNVSAECSIYSIKYSHIVISGIKEAAQLSCIHMTEIDNGNERAIYPTQLNHFVKSSQLIDLSHCFKTYFDTECINGSQRLYKRVSCKPHCLVARNLCRRACMDNDGIGT